MTFHQIGSVSVQNMEIVGKLEISSQIQPERASSRNPVSCSVFTHLENACGGVSVRGGSSAEMFLTGFGGLVVGN